MNTFQRRTLLVAAAGAAGAAATALPGCAALNTVGVEVATYGDWPPERKPGRYAFERLPSQRANPQRQADLEAAAAPALAKAGFAAAADATAADLIVQIGARITRTEIAPWDDPLWWPWAGAYWRSPAWRPVYRPYRYPFGPGWGAGAGFYANPRYERNVALLLRDRAAGTPLFEAHAQTEGLSVGDAALLGAMFEAALADFPAAGASNPRVVRVNLQGR